MGTLNGINFSDLNHWPDDDDNRTQSLYKQLEHMLDAANIFDQALDQETNQESKDKFRKIRRGETGSAFHKDINEYFGEIKLWIPLIDNKYLLMQSNKDGVIKASASRDCVIF